MCGVDDVEDEIECAEIGSGNGENAAAEAGAVAAGIEGDSADIGVDLLRPGRSRGGSVIFVDNAAGNRHTVGLELADDGKSDVTTGSRCDSGSVENVVATDLALRKGGGRSCG